METVKYKYLAKFTELGWKRFLTKVHKEIDDKRLYHAIEDYGHERTECFSKGPAHAIAHRDKDRNTVLYSAGIELNGSHYIIADHDNHARTVELYAIIASEFVPASKVPGLDVDGDTVLFVYM